MVNKTAAELSAIIRAILRAAGADERNTARMEEALVSANLSGVDTHGVWQLPGYVEAIRAGYLVPTAWPAILQDTPTTALVTGNWTFGHVAAKVALEVALTKARDQRVAVVGIVQAHHIGRLGEYAELAAADGMIALIWAGGYGAEEPAAVPYGGKERVLHTNPIAVGLPASDAASVVLDYATTALSGVKVAQAQQRGEALPPGAIVDRDGRPTTNPEDFFAGGGALPFGGHKGYALMVAAEVLGRMYTGADAYAETERGGAIMRHQGVTMLVMRGDIFQPAEDFARRTGDLARQLRAAPPAPGFAEVQVPGDPERRTRAERRREGILIADDVWQSLVEVAASLNVAIS